MSTTNITSWAVDLADVSIIYPFAGHEVLMVTIGVIGWLAWHVWCHRWEKEDHEKIIAEYHKMHQKSDNEP